MSLAELWPAELAAAPLPALGAEGTSTPEPATPSTIAVPSARVWAVPSLQLSATNRTSQEARDNAEVIARMLPPSRRTLSRC
jgi:hypothetical protein